MYFMSVSGGPAINFYQNERFSLFYILITLSPFKHCRVTLKILPERQFRLNETSNHFIQGEGGGRGRGRPLAVGMNQHMA